MNHFFLGDLAPNAENVPTSHTKVVAAQRM
jgi:hypothetical protein